MEPMLDVPVPSVRDLRFFTGAKVPRYWLGGRRSLTIFLDNLSIFFPAGERFFIQSVRRFRDRVGTDRLREEVAAFCAQEGIHRREHARYNEMIRDEGYPAREMEQRVERLLALVTRLAPPRFQLAVTCALEHFTATMAHLLLDDAHALDGAHPSMAALWRWHAAEENEHKAVAYDVFRAAGGTYAERALAMIGASVIFWAKVLEQQARMMKSDGILFSAKEWGDFLRFLFIEPGLVPRLLPLYLDYYRPGFHPWDLDNRELLERFFKESAQA
jgi:predicted metal-dependent hydrolase